MLPRYEAEMSEGEMSVPDICRDDIAKRCAAEIMTSNTTMTAPTVAPMEMSSHVNPTHRGVQHAHI